MRGNEYKKIITEVLRNNHILNLSEIHAKVPEAHFASIYRNVEAMCDEGILKKVVMGKNNVRYELSSHGHGHFICNDCDVVQELDVPIFTDNRRIMISDMLVRGLCGDCSDTKLV